MKKFFITIACIFLVIAIIMGSALSIFAVYTNKNIDYSIDEELFKSAKIESTVYYYAYKGDDLVEVWKDFGIDRREWTAIEYVPNCLKNAFISMEDREFYSHKGINVKRTLAAVANHVFKFKSSFGASTITQQVVKNISGDNEFSIKRKINEIFRAFHLERNHSKDDILEVYLNIVPMSSNMNGVGIAAEIYFGKEVSQLTVAEAATIAGITNAPSKYDPHKYPDECLQKRNRVLYAMLANGSITEEEYNISKNEPLNIIDHNTIQKASSWFIETAREDVLYDLMEKNRVSRSAAGIMLNGAKVILTMNPKIQDIMEDFFTDYSNLSPKAKDTLNYSMVVTDPQSGNLLGIIGSAGKKSAERIYNYATCQITPGSVLKPLALYTPLIDDGSISWSDMFADAPLRYTVSGEGYPKNSPDVYEGEMDINSALKKSKNTVALRLYEMLGAERIFDNLTNKFKLKGLVRDVVSNEGKMITDMAEAPLALGQLSYGISLRNITEAYNAFPNEGVLTTGSSYYYVFDKDGDIILRPKTSSERVFSKATAQVMNQMLMNVVSDGTARQITLDELVDTAGKTGTSGGDRDRLFVGYTPYVTAGIWCGSSSQDGVGSNVPSHLKIWDEIMGRIHEEIYLKGYNENVLSFSTDSVTVYPYCSISGCAVSENCELDDSAVIKYGYFTEDKMPTEKCEYH